MQLQGTVKRVKLYDGTKSEHFGCILENAVAVPHAPLPIATTDCPLRRLNGNPFDDPWLRLLTGKEVICEGFFFDGTFFIEDFHEVISQFKGNSQYRFLSNFYTAHFTWEGLEWENSEQAYQAAKVLDRSEWPRFQTMKPGEAKKAGAALELRPDWEEVKFDTMLSIVRAKFTQDEFLGKCLLATEDKVLQEGNTWGDRIWGISPPSSGNGNNWLGIILMIVRNELRN